MAVIPPGAWERITVIKSLSGKTFRAEARYGAFWEVAGPCDTPYEALNQALNRCVRGNP
jgi:hypothetical protein